MIELRIFQKHFKDEVIMDIDTRKIKDFLKHREDNYEIKSKNSMEKIRGVLRVFFDWLVEEGRVDINPVKRIKAFKIHKDGNTSISKDEINQIRNACQTLRERALIETLLSTGCFIGEIENINLSNFDWGKNTITISGDEERSRVLLLTPKAEEHIKRYLDKRIDKVDTLFVTERKPYRQLSNRGIQNEISLVFRKNKHYKKDNTTYFSTYICKVHA